ncbi:hypothetical protein FBR02_00075 [Anaerolineae bacterium CFX9]|nr:hypothetical protein [Anaerolineae bacterium]MDL1899148.1 hypothetical protein [Anaerolineae bacterium CFX9]GIK76123.1 MAG: hypothetical protein BroJett021_51110 [Chloroflexota bacterium]
MKAITAIYDHLAVALTTDPLLLLAAAAATFDPFWDEFEDDIDYDTDPLTIALQVTRGAFPDLYADAIERLRAGVPYAELDRLLCRGISAKGIPIDDLETIGWGIPLVALGIELEDPQFYAVHSDLLPILAPFGIDIPEGETYHIDVPEAIRQVSGAIAHSLHEQTDPALQQVSWLFGWLFSCTGNSLVDYSDEMLGEIPPLSWSKEDIAFAVEMIEEADGIMHDAMAGLDILKTTPDLMTTLERHIATLYRELKQKGKLNEQSIRLEWTGPSGSTERAAVADAQFLLVRGDAA